MKKSINISTQLKQSKHILFFFKYIQMSTRAQKNKKVFSKDCILIFYNAIWCTKCKTTSSLRFVILFKNNVPRGYTPLNQGPLFDDDPGIMSEVETASTGFRRGNKQRSSLPVVRTPSKTLERPLGEFKTDIFLCKYFP